MVIDLVLDIRTKVGIRITWAVIREQGESQVLIQQELCHAKSHDMAAFIRSGGNGQERPSIISIIHHPFQVILSPDGEVTRDFRQLPFVASEKTKLAVVLETIIAASNEDLKESLPIDQLDW